MARSFTLAQIATKVRQRADIEKSDFVSPTELVDYINTCYAELYELLVASGQSYFETEQLFTTTGVNTVPLTADYLATQRLDWLPDSQTRVRIPMIQVHEVDRYRLTAGQVAAHRLVGSNIVLYPTPPAGQNFSHLYVPACPLLALDADVLDGIGGWEELVVLGAAIKVGLKEETDVTLLLRQQDELRVRISTSAADRQITSTASVQDAGNCDRGDQRFLEGEYRFGRRRWW